MTAAACGVWSDSKSSFVGVELCVTVSVCLGGGRPVHNNELICYR